MKIQSMNPATGAVLETFDETPPQEIDRILGRAHAIAFSLDYEHHYAPRFDRFFGGIS